MDVDVNKKFFTDRLPMLRESKNISAREMSLSLAMNPGYINNIECGKALPIMQNFFYICEFLRLTPRDFFDEGTTYPEALNELIENAKKLSNTELVNLNNIVRSMIKDK